MVGTSAAPSGDALPLAPGAVLALLGNEFRQARWVGVAPVALRSRNRLYRVELADAPQSRLILKFVRREDDPYWQHHLRREHWLLELLQRFWPAAAPRPYAAAFGQGWGLLAMEDVGERSLAEAFGTSVPGTAADIALGGGRVSSPLLSAVDRLAALQALLRRQHRVFFRVCQSVELDRINASVLLDRLRVAQRRFGSAEGGSGTPRTLPPAVLRQYQERVVRPLLASPRQMVHNSLSPLNVVLGPTPRFVDWETMAYAAPEFDLADLLRFPTTNLAWPVVDQLVATAFGPAIDPLRLRLAALARSLDYAGSNAQQAAKSHDAGDTGHELLATARRDWYLQEGKTLAEELALAGLMDSIVGRGGRSALPRPLS